MIKTFAGFVVLVVIGCAACAYADSVRSLELRIRGVAFSVEVADTAPARARGLMERKALAKNHGMLFIFPELGCHTMWMSNTYIPLSAAFLDERGTILNIDDMVPLTTNVHRPGAPAKYVLEMNQGWFKAHHVEVGARVLGLPIAAANNE